MKGRIHHVTLQCLCGMIRLRLFSTFLTGWDGLADYVIYQVSVERLLMN